ncbi:diguanylate cyclase [Paenibacillus sp. NFR01]|uniref:diguanylate cyclase domain-containing protein n=1 Tax=Paenibacillus sp. NFR01 TaxID=1566279 RepID=UPI0008ACF794|nr:diguanylate cyclase [Paenibacillus sp. NFR01]SET15942.1 diguanylate cyclase (GGDEF) domain-containing protein [Paenibacillus sp. NFR01]
MKLNLRTFFTGLFALIAVLLTALTLLIVHRHGDTLMDNAGRSFAVYAQALAEERDRHVWANARELELLSQAAVFRGLAEPARIEDALNTFQRSLPYFAWTGYIRAADGIVAADTGHLLTGQDLGSQPIYKDGLLQTMIQSVQPQPDLAGVLHLNPAHLPRFIGISLPVYGSDGAVAGVLAAYTYASDADWEASAQNREKKTAATPDDRDILIIRTADGAVIEGGTIWLGSKLSGDVLAEAKKQGNGWVADEEAGQNSYVSGYALSQGYRGYQGKDVAIIVREPRSAVLAGLYRLERFIALCGAAAMIILALLGRMIGGSLAAALASLTGSAEQLACAPETVSIPPMRMPELEALGNALRLLSGGKPGRGELRLIPLTDTTLHDLLTGLPNREALDGILVQGMQKARQNKSSLSVLHLDLDGFKKVNDGPGFAAGDLLLKEAAHRLVGCIRDHEIVARIGGDEFIVVLSTSAGKPMQEAEVVASRIIGRLNQPYMIDGKSIQVGCSIGAAVWLPEGPDIREVLELADEALFISKRSGHNRITFEATG